MPPADTVRMGPGGWGEILGDLKSLEILDLGRGRLTVMESLPQQGRSPPLRTISQTWGVCCPHGSGRSPSKPTFHQVSSDLTWPYHCWGSDGHRGTLASLREVGFKELWDHLNPQTSEQVWTSSLFFCPMFCRFREITSIKSMQARV